MFPVLSVGSKKRQKKGSPGGKSARATLKSLGN